jgi:hypothetical protein
LKAIHPNPHCGLDPQSQNHFRKHDSTKVRQYKKNNYELLPTKPPLSRFLHGLGFNLASPKLCGKADRQGARPRSCGRTLCLSATPPSAARRPASTSISPWARVAAVVGIIIFLLALAPLRHMPGAATWYLESLYF